MTVNSPDTIKEAKRRGLSDRVNILRDRQFEGTFVAQNEVSQNRSNTRRGIVVD
jgi:hypothetical protein